LEEKTADEVFHEIRESLAEANGKLTEVVDLLFEVENRLQELGDWEDLAGIRENRVEIEQLQNRIDYWKEEV